jgi:alpha-amylase/alpha-mannosidase (GH57 family)
MSNCSLCIHSHFYQPSRVNPFTGKTVVESAAAPYTNWNERITAECYAPNAEPQGDGSGSNFAHISFNLGGTLAWWLEHYAHDTYQRIIAAETSHREIHGIGNGLAQPLHHTILPLARRRDKVCQIRWGIANFEHRFGHRPEGMWLPEMAVDYETLEILVAEGIRFTVLSPEQVNGDMGAGAGPYWVWLPSGARIAVFLRDVALSNALSFGMPDLAHTDKWVENHIVWRCRLGGLLLIATDGETFGHHHRQGVEVLSRILRGGQANGYELTTLGLYLNEHPPQIDVEIVEDTAWSCSHGLNRWVAGCDCTPGDSRWKGTLRRALDHLASELDWSYAQEAQRAGVDPWPLRDDFIAVQLEQIDGRTLFAKHGLDHLSSEDAQHLLWLLEAQFYRQRMYASCAFFFEDLDRQEPRYAIANAVQAIALNYYATGDDLSGSFRRDLRIVVSQNAELTGADILEQMLEQAEL